MPGLKTQLIHLYRTPMERPSCNSRRVISMVMNPTTIETIVRTAIFPGLGMNRSQLMAILQMAVFLTVPLSVQQGGKLILLIFQCWNIFPALNSVVPLISTLHLILPVRVNPLRLISRQLQIHLYWPPARLPDSPGQQQRSWCPQQILLTVLTGLKVNSTQSV